MKNLLVNTLRSVVQRSLDLLHALIQQSFCRVLGSQMDKKPHHGIKLCIWILPHMFKVTDPSEKSTIVLPRNGFGGSLACVLQKYEIKTWGHGCLVSGIAV